MARTKNRPAAAPSAAHAAPDPAPAPGTAAAPDSPAAAVHAALAASPGTTVAVIASAAGTGKPAARDALLAMEKAGTATRARGGKPGIPDTWTLAGPAQDDAGPAPGPEDEQGGQPGDGPAGSPDGPGHDDAAGEAAPDATAATASPGQQDGDADAEAAASAAPDPETGKPGPHDDAPAGEEDPGGEQDDEAVPDSDPQDPDTGEAPREDAAPAGGDGAAGDAPDPALVTEIAERIAQITTAADAAAIVLAGGGNLRATLAGLEEIHEQATQARRSLKDAIGGRKTPAARPGGLRDKVLAHLDAHPGAEFTPHEIHKVLSHSSGAIANALDTLVKLGEAELATDKPRKFRRAAGKTAPAAARAGGAGSGQDGGTELAGAA